jgi:hypothetical protein
MVVGGDACDPHGSERSLTPADLSDMARLMGAHLADHRQELKTLLAAESKNISVAVVSSIESMIALPVLESAYPAETLGQPAALAPTKEALPSHKENHALFGPTAGAPIQPIISDHTLPPPPPLRDVTPENSRGVVLTAQVQKDEMTLEALEETLEKSPVVDRHNSLNPDAFDLQRQISPFALGVSKNSLTVEVKIVAAEVRNMRERLQLFLNRPTVEYSIATLIIANALTFGVQADYTFQHPHEGPPQSAQYLEWCFTVAFTVELCLRLAAYGWSFFSFSNADIAWNVLDLFLVLFAYVEQLLDSVLSSGAPNLSSARLVRLFRLLRIIRVLKVLRFFRAMRVMVMGILSSLKPLLRALLLLALIIYVFAIVIVQVLEEDLDQLKNNSGPRGHFFTSFPRLMHSLFMCISGGVSWVEVSDPIAQVNAAFAPFFAMYVSFCVFCVLNIVTGVFVEQSTRMSKEDDENMVLDEIEGRRRWIKDIQGVFRKVDTDMSGTVNFSEFEEAHGDLAFQASMKHLGIDVAKVEPSKVWALLDIDDEGTIDIDTFAAGLQHMHGEAKSIHIARLMHEMKGAHRDVKTLLRLEHKIEDFCKALIKIERSEHGAVQELLHEHQGFSRGCSPMPAPSPKPVASGNGQRVLEL